MQREKPRLAFWLGEAFLFSRLVKDQEAASSEVAGRECIEAVGD